MYNFFEQIKQDYQLLQDALSKKIFWARLMLDLEWTAENAKRLVCLGEEA